MDLGKIIGENLRRLRTERNLSLGQLAKTSEISKGILSEIEKGNSNPTINTILKIADGLSTPYTALLEEPEKECDLIRKEDTAIQRDDFGTYRLRCYFPCSFSRNFEYFQMELDAGCSHTSIGHPPKAQEYLYVIRGTVALTAGSEEHVLHPGDALLFASSIPHVYENRTNETAECMIINYYGK